MSSRNMILGLGSYRGKLRFEGIQMEPAATPWTSDPRYPLAANAGSLPGSRVARATGNVVQYATFLDRPRLVQVAAHLWHNWSGAATLRRRFYADTALSTLLHDTGIAEPEPEIFPLSQVEREDDEWWSGKRSEEDKAGLLRVAPTLLPEPMMVEAVVTDIDDSSNGEGYVEFGLDELARGWQVSVNPDFGLEIGFDFQTTTKRAWGGRVIADHRPKPRIWAGTLDYMPLDEFWAKAWEFMRRYDKHFPFLVIPDPGDPMNLLRQAGLFYSRPPGSAKWIDVDGFQFPFKFEECLD